MYMATVSFGGSPSMSVLSQVSAHVPFSWDPEEGWLARASAYLSWAVLNLKYESLIPG